MGFNRVQYKKRKAAGSKIKKHFNVGHTTKIDPRDFEGNRESQRINKYSGNKSQNFTQNRVGARPTSSNHIPTKRADEFNRDRVIRSRTISGRRDGVQVEAALKLRAAKRRVFKNGKELPRE